MRCYIADRAGAESVIHKVCLVVFGVAAPRASAHARARAEPGRTTLRRKLRVGLAGLRTEPSKRPLSERTARAEELQLGFQYAVPRRRLGVPKLARNAVLVVAMSVDAVHVSSPIGCVGPSQMPSQPFSPSDSCSQRRQDFEQKRLPSGASWSPCSQVFTRRCPNRPRACPSATRASRGATPPWPST